MKHRDGAFAGLISNSAFWQAATVAVPVASATAVMLFGLVIGLADAAYPTFEVSKHLVFAIVMSVMVVAVGLLVWRRTPRTLGAATGIVIPGLLLMLVWLVNL
ncbi:hypothetical protein ACQPXH_22305 [Nocardia sp. CA-135953]|uniref:hypothetical protein n=1 Tax=Nocardia sp. CA-135953 TaxID=3239978 RepID=UPI003D99E8CA